MTAVAAGVAVYLSRTYLQLAQFPSSPGAGRAMVDAVADPDPSVSYMAHRLLSERTHRTDVPQTKDDWAKVVK